MPLTFYFSKSTPQILLLVSPFQHRSRPRRPSPVSGSLMHCVNASPFRGSPCVLISARWSGGASRPWIIRAYAEKRFVAGHASQQNTHMKELETKVRKQLQRVELPPSPYDTAWVSMVPLRGSDHIPCFPQCVEWIMMNQQDDGSWDISQFDSSVNKSVLLSTLACVLALKKWNVGRENISRGLHFIGKNFSIAMDDQNIAPIGFNITFPSLLSLATGMGLELPVDQKDIDTILHLREVELKRLEADSSYGRKTYMAYVGEGLGDLLDWNEIIKFQRKNGSLFNSPSTTAAALIHGFNDQTLRYLNLLVSKSNGAVPAVYPLNIHCKLSMVDALEKMGISQYFVSEIRSILDMVYRCWLMKDEELIMDIKTYAMAFRILRMNGYNVSSDELSHLVEASTFHDTLQGYLGDTETIMELHRASKFRLLENEVILDEIGYWSGNLLKDKLCSKEVQCALKFPFYPTHDRLEHKRNIEHFDTKGCLMLKTEYSPYKASQELHTLAIEDFCFSQSVYQDELRHLDSWMKDSKLDQLQFARQILTYCYLSAVDAMFPSELSDARISWAKNAVLITVIDDFFDIGGSREELENLIAVVEKWHEHHEDMFYSEQVKTIFSAIYTTANQLGAKASAAQDRDVTKHLAEIWLDLLRSEMLEAEWQQKQYVPTVEEYMTTAVVTLALGPIFLPALYFLGEKLFENVVKDKEFGELFKLLNTCGRLLNDIKGFEREHSEGKLNSVSLLVLHSGGSMSIESAKREIQKSIDTCRRNLLTLVLKEESAVPMACKDPFWKMCKMLHMFYSETDGFSSSKELIGAMNALTNEPLELQRKSSSSILLKS